MQDLTRGSVTRHLFQLSAFMAVSIFFQTLYYLADLYWVSRLGKEAIAAVGLSGNIMLVVLAVTQSLGVGTTTLVSHAVGQKDHRRAGLVFNQAMLLSLCAGAVFAAIAFWLRGAYCRWLGADAKTVLLGEKYLLWFIPALLLQFVVIAMGSALRATGVVKPTVAIQVLTVILNIILNPVLIFGWGFGRPLGVTGAAVATLVSVAVGVVAFLFYFLRPGQYLEFALADWRPQWKIWGGMIRVGLPAGGEFALMSVYMMVVYWIIRAFGASAQAGFGIGARLMQSLFMPVMAVAFAVAPVAGQNFGARISERVRQSFYSAAALASGIMILWTVVCQLAAPWLIRLFSHEPAVVAFGTEYLKIISWNFVAVGLIFTSSSIFQGMGNTLPPLASSSTRLLLFALPAYWLSTLPGFQLRQVWYLSIASVAVQSVVNLLLLRREFRRKLVFMPAEARIEMAGAAAQ